MRCGLGWIRGTFERFTERISQLYEQGAGVERIGEYVKHWFKWVRTGISKKDWVGSGTGNRKRLHLSANEECRRLNYLFICYCVLAFPFSFILELLSCRSSD